ncbi:hypothetical protein NDU88_000966 [Pleurodeles waltl]|uniref:Uncharacterized protein n=1 Tax=Pleurodeles waltl TaxID=8319 RepID=A0AAV7NCW2_PLEWA|nr:hypothetical protein NDU88_000966 [Pleurodeles waltl]
MAWAYFCWRDGGGFVTSTFPPTAGLAVCCGGRIFGGLPSAGQNDRGGFPRPRRDYGGFLTGGRRLLPPRKKIDVPIKSSLRGLSFRCLFGKRAFGAARLKCTLGIA